MEKLKFRRKEDSITEEAKIEPEDTSELNELVKKVQERKQIQSSLLLKSKSKDELKMKQLEREQISAKDKATVEVEDYYESEVDKLTSERDNLLKRVIQLEIENDNLLNKVDELELFIAKHKRKFK